MGHILVVEDEDDARETLKDLLELEGFVVLTAANGEEALMVLERMGQPCLVLLDLMMPIMNGWEFLKAARSQRSDLLGSTPVVVVSAAADVGNVRESIGCRVLKKPTKIDQLLAIAREHCEPA